MEIDIAGHTVLVDDDDYARIAQHKWFLKKDEGRIYFSANLPTINKKQPHITLHRFIMNCATGDGLLVDHKNRNTLDNRKENLRLASSSGNCCNKSIGKDNITGYKGVSIYRPRPDMYVVHIRHNKKQLYVGKSSSIIEAAELYDMMATKLHGEYASLNFPEKEYSLDSIECLYKGIMGTKQRNNTSGYTGVYEHSRGGRWVAGINYKKKGYYLGIFDNAVSAARAYDRKAIELFGDDAVLNFTGDAV